MSDLESEEDDMDIKMMFKEIKRSQLTKADITDSVDLCLGPIKLRLDAVEATAASNQNDIAAIVAENAELKAGMLRMEKKMVRFQEVYNEIYENGLDSLDASNINEQYTRKSSILIFNLKTDPRFRCEAGREPMDVCRIIVSEMLSKNLELDIPPDRFSVAHRLPKSKTPSAASQAPPMYARFIRLEDKVSVMRAVKEKNLNSNKSLPSIKHDLTRKNKILLDDIFKHPDFSHGWYYNGNIYASTKDDFRVGPINITSNLDSVFKEREIIGTRVTKNLKKPTTLKESSLSLAVSDGRPSPGGSGIKSWTTASPGLFLSRSEQISSI